MLEGESSDRVRSKVEWSVNAFRSCKVEVTAKRQEDLKYRTLLMMIVSHDAR